MDYLLCLLTARFAGIPLRRRRYALAGLLGGAYAVAIFLPGMQFFSEVPLKLAAGVILAWIAFGNEETFLRLTIVLFAIACAMAGGILVLGMIMGSTVPMMNGVFYTNVNGKALLIMVTVTYLIGAGILRASLKHGLAGELFPVKVCVSGRTEELTVLLDTGNGLRDPVSEQPVLVVSPGSLDAALPTNIRRMLTQDRLKNPDTVLPELMGALPTLRPRLIPYRAVGTTGLLLTVELEWMEISGERISGVRAALSPTSLGTGYTALWGGAVRKMGDRS